MRFINKILNKSRGNALLNNFLNTMWDNTDNRYNSIAYSSRKFKEILRSDLKQLLLEEQSRLCCYCMRQLDDETTTFEHIIPKSTLTLEQLNQYTHLDVLRENVCLQSVFDNAVTQQTTPPFPLEIAYENLAASCKGTFPGGLTYYICNHKRGNDFVQPLFYISTIEDEIKYEIAGLLWSTNSAYDGSIEMLNLNYNSLKRIRQVWYHISVENINDIESATTEDTRNEILTINLISLPPVIRTNLIADFKTETFWNILLQYKWFYSYYQRQYLIETR